MSAHDQHGGHEAQSLNRLAFSATTHCLTGCAIGEVFGTAIGIAFAADTLSIVVMEIVDNVIVLLVPGAMEAGLTDLLFWGSLIVALATAFAAAFPVNRMLIARGHGHAVVHQYN